MRNPYKQILRSLGLPYRPILGESSSKTIKGESIGFLTGIVYLTPDDELCPLARLAGCIDPCLKSAGRGGFKSVQKARKAKTEFFKNHREAFLLSLCADTWSLVRKARKLGMIPRVCLYGGLHCEVFRFWCRCSMMRIRDIIFSCLFGIALGVLIALGI